MVEFKHYHRGYSSMGRKHFGALIIEQVLEMKAQGKTRQEIADHFGLKDGTVIKELVKRHNRKQRQIAAGFLPRKKGRPRKRVPNSEREKDNLIKQLQMENEVLRAFLLETGRR